MLSLVFVGTEKIQGFVNNNKPYNSQKATKFATKKNKVLYINKKATKKISLIMIKIKPKI